MEYFDEAARLVQRLQHGRRMVQLQTASSLAQLADEGGEAACEAAVAAGAIPALTRLLHSGSAAVQKPALQALINLAAEGGTGVLAAIAEEGGVQAVVPLLASRDSAIQHHAAAALANLCADETGARAAADAGGVQPLAAILIGSSGGGNSSGDSEAQQSSLGAAAKALGRLTALGPELRAAAAAAGIPATLVQALKSHPAEKQGAAAAAALRRMVFEDLGSAAAVVAAGGIEALAGVIACSTPPNDAPTALEDAASLLAMLVSKRPGWCAAAVATGCIPGLVRLLGGSSDNLVYAAAVSLDSITQHGGEAAAAELEAAGGIEALVALVSRADLTDGTLSMGAGALGNLAAAGRFDAAGAPSILPIVARLCSSPDAELRQWLEAAREKLSSPPAGPQAAAAAAAAGTAAAAAGQQAGSQQQQRPPRICAAPGCSVTAGLRRCGGCGSVRYCSAACSKAHWRAHKAECRRLQAERAAAAEEAQGGSG